MNTHIFEHIFKHKFDHKSKHKLVHSFSIRDLSAHATSRHLFGACFLGMTLFISACSFQKKQEATEQPILENLETSGVVSITGLDDSLSETNPNWGLSVATYYTKIEDTYFLVDCYHNQVLYTTQKEAPLYEWNVLCNDVHYAHTIASNGSVYLIDDTENNRILVYQKSSDPDSSGDFVRTQIFENVGDHPHFIYYDEKREQFMVWSSYSGEMYYFTYDDTTQSVFLSKIMKLASLEGIYIRSFTMIDDKIYLASSLFNPTIYVLDADTFKILETYAVPNELSGMAQIYKIQDYYYLTVSTDHEGNQSAATIVRTKSLSELANGSFEDISTSLGLTEGTPYYINEVEGHYYLSHHGGTESIVEFDVIENEITNVRVLY